MDSTDYYAMLTRLETAEAEREKAALKSNSKLVLIKAEDLRVLKSLAKKYDDTLVFIDELDLNELKKKADAYKATRPNQD